MEEPSGCSRVLEAELPIVKILIAEDDATSRVMLSAFLRKLGHEVTETDDGLAAWEAFQRSQPDIVVTDWMMPRKSGVELVRAIRAAERPAYTYIFILTALSSKDKFLVGLEAGADDYLTKPVDADELAARLVVGQRTLGLQARMERLEGMLPICSYCKRIRTEDGEWADLENYVAAHSDASFTHSVCSVCYTVRVEPQLADQERAVPKRYR